MSDDGTINLDSLEHEAAQLLALLRDRHPGLMTWNLFLGQRIAALRKVLAEGDVSLVDYAKDTQPTPESR